MLKGFGMFRQAHSDHGIHILVYAAHDLELSPSLEDFAIQRVEDAFRGASRHVFSAH
jgi:hypothetical protein